MWSQNKKDTSTKTVPTPPPAGSSATRKWVRESFKRTSKTQLPQIENLLDPLKGLRNIPITPIQGLDGYNLRGLNHGHKNLRQEGLTQNSPETYSRPESASLASETTIVSQRDMEERLKKVTFPVPEHWKRKSFLGVKEKKPSLTLTDLMIQKEASIAANEEKVQKSREGFMTVETGIGTGRGNSPTYKKQFAEELTTFDPREDDVVNDDGISAFMLLKTVTMKPVQRGDKELQRKTSTIGVRLAQKSKALRLWHEEEIGEVANRPAKPFYNENAIASAHLPPASQVSSDLEMGSAITSFIRVPVSPGLRLPERVKAEDQKTNLLKGGHGMENTLADLKMLAESLKRMKDPARYKDEAKAVLSMGVIYDNRMEFPKAREQYERFLELCKLLGDAEGEAVGYNFLGCNIQESQDLKLACQRDQIVLVQGAAIVDTQVQIEYEKAADYHQKHAELADVEGKFIAYTNLGLLYATLSKWGEAAKSHKKALKCATFVDSPQEQCIAVGNLGFLLFRRKKMLAAKACLIRYLQICRLLGDIQGQARAHYTLGNIAAQMKKWEEAEGAFKAAVKAAKVYGDKQIETFSKVQIGIVRGNAAFTKRKASFEEYNPDISMFMPTESV
ncbi:unnamed protein product [Calypogeia fissa]